LKCLASYDLIDQDELSNGYVKRTDNAIPKEISEKINELTIEQENILKLVIGFTELPLFWEIGIKK